MSTAQRLKLAHDYLRSEWRANRLSGPMSDALIDSLNEPIPKEDQSYRALYEDACRAVVWMQNDPAIKAKVKLGSRLEIDGVAALREEVMELRKDAARIELLNRMILRQDPAQQFHRLTDGPALGDITLAIYNGREMVEYASNHLRNVIDAAMKEGR